MSVRPRPQNFDPFKTCATIHSCLETDINMICNTNLTTQVLVLEKVPSKGS